MAKIDQLPTKGEGKILDINDERIAVYQDVDGELKAFSAVCPHAGCELEWNNDEKTWDCPCHGSRFYKDGSVLAEPAEEPLTPLSVDVEDDHITVKRE